MKYMRNNKFKFRKIPFLLMLLLIFSAVVMAQGKRTITGVVTDTNGEPIVGANVVVQNNHSIGAITDIEKLESLHKLLFTNHPTQRK